MDHTKELLNQRLGNYHLQRFLGRGGFADVYLAEHVALHTQVAVKVLRVRLAENARQDFLREARIIAQLDHPHIVRVFECDIEGNFPYLVMTYAPFGSLRQRHPRGTRLPIDQVMTYIQQVASALQYAHEHKLIHRDIKPENMLIGSHNELLLSDFGLVLMVQSSSSLTTQEIAGTAPYMAPEQFHGKPRQASDQYALGVVAYELLCGECPFKGNFVQVVGQHILGNVPSLCEKLPDLPPDVEAVIFKALAKAPQDRYASIQAFSDALTDAAQVTVSRNESPATHHVADAIENTTQHTLSTSLREPHHTPPTVQHKEVASSPAVVEQPLETPPPLPIQPASSKGKTLSTEKMHIPPHMPERHKHTRKRWLVVSCILLLILLAVSGTLYLARAAIFPSHPSATVTITPDSRMLRATYTIQAVTGTPDVARYQVQARSLLETSPVGSQTINASGKGHRDATYAHGTVSMCADNSMTYGATQTYAANTVFTSNNLNRVDSEGHVLAIKITQSATVKQPADGKQYDSKGNPVPGLCQDNVSALYAYPGSVGNIAPHTDATGTSEPFSTLTAEGVRIDSGLIYFTGGQDAQDYTFVQQDDIDRATTALPDPAAPDAQKVLGGPLPAHERWLAPPSCQKTTAADHAANDQASAVTVTRAFHCSGLAYDYDGAIHAAILELQAQASKDPGKMYVASGGVHASVQLATPGTNGVINIVVATSGLWNFQISNAQKLLWQRALKGMSKSKAKTWLQGQPGIKQVSIVLTGGNADTFPDTGDDITISVRTPT